MEQVVPELLFKLTAEEFHASTRALSHLACRIQDEPLVKERARLLMEPFRHVSKLFRLLDAESATMMMSCEELAAFIATVYEYRQADPNITALPESEAMLLLLLELRCRRAADEHFARLVRERPASPGGGI